MAYALTSIIEADRYHLSAQAKVAVEADRTGHEAPTMTGTWSAPLAPGAQAQATGQCGSRNREKSSGLLDRVLQASRDTGGRDRHDC